MFIVPSAPSPTAVLNTMPKRLPSIWQPYSSTLNPPAGAMYSRVSTACIHKGAILLTHLFVRVPRVLVMAARSRTARRPCLFVPSSDGSQCRDVLAAGTFYNSSLTFARASSKSDRASGDVGAHHPVFRLGPLNTPGFTLYGSSEAAAPASSSPPGHPAPARTTPQPRGLF